VSRLTELELGVDDGVEGDYAWFKLAMLF